MILRLIYSLSFCAALGLTLICSTINGQPAPTISDDSSNNTRPIAGIRKSRMAIAENTAAAQINAIAIRISFAGRTALISVYPAPVNGLPPRVCDSSSYRPSQ
ncbi:Uncharacterised protein [Mycobacterium tuberculosis]|nr:Uncharacterised protein [Mycobacterium tuberculosis]